MKDRNTPKIRFPEFADDWEQHKCGDVLIERNLQHPQSTEFPLVSFTVENGVTPKTERYEREQLVTGDKKAKKYKETRLDDIVYNPANLKFGAIARNKYGNAVFSPIYVTYEVDRSLALPSFIEMVVTRDSFIQNALQYQQGTVFERMSVNTYDFASLDIELPSIEEQQKIGEYLGQLDNLINLYQCKCEKLKEYKKGCLGKMFPREGAPVPEVRFPGFNDDWEQRKLGEVLEFQNGFNGGRKAFGEGIALISVMDILNNQFITYDSIRGKATVTDDEFKRYSVNYGDVLFQRSSENVEDAGSTNVYIDSDKSAIFGGFVIRGKQIYPYKPKFMKYLLDTKTVRNQITKKAQGAQHVNVSQETLQDVSINLPKEEEQIAIENFLYNLDNLITFHQRKVISLKSLKQGMLQQMFI